MISRRNLLYSGVALSALSLTGASCQQQIQASWNAFVDQVNAILATGCGVVPGFLATAQTIAAIVNVIYPGAGTAVSSIVGAVQTVANAICSSIPNPPPATLAAKLLKSTPNVPTVVGYYKPPGGGQPIPIVAYSARFGRRYHYGDARTLLWHH